jgi:hypothetical protein
MMGIIHAAESHIGYLFAVRRKDEVIEVDVAKPLLDIR